jgi:hypothetical protein
MAMEDFNMAVLCLRYLTFECFDPKLPEQSIIKFLTNGYYSFHDYAVMHWVDHLESIVKSLRFNSLLDHDELGGAIEDFFKVYGAGEAKSEDVRKELEELGSMFPDAEYLESMLLMISQARTARKADEQISALGELGRTIARIRSLLEDLNMSSTLEAEKRKLLELYYGTQWSKCPRHLCFYFHEGFSTFERRNRHVDRHERPFCCTESGCPRILIGYSSEKELKKHVNINHPNPSSFAWKFPKAKKGSIKHRCTFCENEYTRASSLRIHIRTHNNERPYNCKTCGKAFVRKHDCSRHERLLHDDQGQMVEDDALTPSQATL